jgi:hypothetical protein
MNREEKYAALFARLSEAMPGYWTSRNFLTSDRIPEWPALLVWATTEQADPIDFDPNPSVWRLAAVVRLHVLRSDPIEPFEPTIHAAMDAVDDALKAQAGEDSFGQATYTTLGGVVLEAKLKGLCEIFRHPEDQRAVIEMPVEMLATF